MSSVARHLLCAAVCLITCCVFISDKDLLSNMPEVAPLEWTEYPARALQTPFLIQELQEKKLCLEKCDGIEVSERLGRHGDETMSVCLRPFHLQEMIWLTGCWGDNDLNFIEDRTVSLTPIHPTSYLLAAESRTGLHLLMISGCWKEISSEGSLPGCPLITLRKLWQKELEISPINTIFLSPVKRGPTPCACDDVVSGEQPLHIIFSQQPKVKQQKDVGWSHIVLGRIHFEDEFHFRIIVTFFLYFYWSGLHIFLLWWYFSLTGTEKLYSCINLILPTQHNFRKYALVFHPDKLSNNCIFYFFSLCMLFCFSSQSFSLPCKGYQTVLDHSALLNLMLQYVWLP